MKIISKLIPLRYLSIWLIIWGNMSAILDFTFLRFNFYDYESSMHLRIYFYSACFSLIICYWLIPWIQRRDLLIFQNNSMNNYLNRLKG